MIAKVKAAVDTLRESLKGDDLELIKKNKEELQKPLYELAAELYKETEGRQQAGAQPGAEGPKADDDVVDAEVVDDKK